MCRNISKIVLHHHPGSSAVPFQLTRLTRAGTFSLIDNTASSKDEGLSFISYPCKVFSFPYLRKTFPLRKCSTPLFFSSVLGWELTWLSSECQGCEHENVPISDDVALDCSFALLIVHVQNTNDKLEELAKNTGLSADISSPYQQTLWSNSDTLLIYATQDIEDRGGRHRKC